MTQDAPAAPRPPPIQPAAAATGRLDRYVPRGLLEHLVNTPEQQVRSEDGTMVFVDLSGFTKLSERLARAGREGAEHLVDTISACFSTLLAEAYANGGSLVKFGGDALLVWFAEDDHSARACSSAIAMRRTLRQIGRIRAGASSIVLRMSVGVHSGRYEFFLVGGSHREYLIGGPSVRALTALESAAQAGQILVSDQTAALLPARCLGARSEPGVLLARAPTTRLWMLKDAAPRPSDEQVAHCLSTALRAHLLAAHTHPEHRTATVSFLQFGELDAVIAAEGPDAAADAVGEVVCAAQEAADRYEVCVLGSDIAADGGKLLFSAGAPRAIGDDEERMLLTLRHVIDARTRLPVRAGVTRGYVFTGEVGPPYRRTYAVMGDVVNLAARLSAKAPWREVYAIDPVLRHAHDRFARTAVPPFMVKGKSRPIEAFAVGPVVRAVAPGSAAKGPPLIGREQELELIRRSIAEAIAGAGRLIDLVGDSGAGKSRLLAEARMLGDGMRLVHATGESYTQAIPYIGWREPLRQLLGLEWDDADAGVLERLRERVAQAHPDLLPWLPLLAIAAGVELASTREVEELSPDFRTAKLQEVVLSFLAPALELPTLVLVEHAHLIDDASAALLHALTPRLERSSWLVIVAHRDVPSGFASQPGAASRLELEPLSREATHALAESTPEAHLIPPHMLELAVERSAGSPAFLLELLAAAAGGSEALPDSIEVAASARIDALDPSDRSLVRRASVLGLSFRPPRLRHVLEPDAAEPDAATWGRLSGVLVSDPDGQLHFKSPIICEAAYLGLPFRMRRALHAAVGEALEPELGTDVDADPAVLSLHFSLAGDHARAWRYGLMGAERATARFAHADAVRLFRRAIEAGRANGVPAAELGSAWEALGEELRLTGEPKAALQALSIARRLVGGDPIAEARLLHHHADITERHERLTASVRWLQSGLRALEGLDDPEAEVWRARLIADLGGVRMRQGRVADAIALSRDAIARAESIGELRALARACYLLDSALFESGQREEATYSQRALEIYDRLGDAERAARATMNLGTFAYVEGRWDDAVELYRQGAELSRRAGNLDVAATGDCNIGEILSDQGRLEEAAVSLERARRVWRSVGQLQGVAFVTLLLGRLAVREGRYADGLSLLELATAELSRMSLTIYLGLAKACVAEAEAFGGDPRRAIAIADELLAAGDRNVALVRRVRAIALAQLGRAGDAVEQLELSVAAAAEARSDYDLAAGLDVLDVLGARPAGAIERDEIIARLRIERLPAPPLRQPVEGRPHAVPLPG